MQSKLFSIASRVATPISVASVALIALYLISKAILGLEVFGDLSSDQTLIVINSLADKLFYIAITTAILGVAAYVYVNRLKFLQREQGKTLAVKPLQEKRVETPAELLYCSFCGKSQHEVRKLIAGPGAYICDECSDLCLDVLDEEPRVERLKGISTLCELTLELANPLLPSTERIARLEKVDQIAASIRSRRRERTGDMVGGAVLIRIIGSGNFSTQGRGLIGKLPSRSPTKTSWHKVLCFGGFIAGSAR